MSTQPQPHSHSHTHTCPHSHSHTHTWPHSHGHTHPKPHASQMLLQSCVTTPTKLYFICECDCFNMTKWVKTETCNKYTLWTTRVCLCLYRVLFRVRHLVGLSQTVLMTL